MPIQYPASAPPATPGGAPSSPPPAPSPPGPPASAEAHHADDLSLDRHGLLRQVHGARLHPGVLRDELDNRSFPMKTLDGDLAGTAPDAHDGDRVLPNLGSLANGDE